MHGYSHEVNELRKKLHEVHTEADKVEFKRALAALESKMASTGGGSESDKSAVKEFKKKLDAVKPEPSKPPEVKPPEVTPPGPK
jgi:hypothetical protein